MGAETNSTVTANPWTAAQDVPQLEFNVDWSSLPVYADLDQSLLSLSNPHDMSSVQAIPSSINHSISSLSPISALAPQSRSGPLISQTSSYSTSQSPLPIPLFSQASSGSSSQTPLSSGGASQVDDGRLSASRSFSSPFQPARKDRKR